MQGNILTLFHDATRLQVVDLHRTNNIMPIQSTLRAHKFSLKPQRHGHPLSSFRVAIACHI